MSWPKKVFFAPLLDSTLKYALCASEFYNSTIFSHSAKITVKIHFSTEWPDSEYIKKAFTQYGHIHVNVIYITLPLPIFRQMPQKYSTTLMIG